MSEAEQVNEKARARKKRKLERQAAGAQGEASKWQPLDSQGRERPAFLASFPEDPELKKLSRAFEQGNYALVRDQAPRLAENTEDEAVKQAALELCERIKPDPLLKYVLIISSLLLIYLIIYAYTGHGHG